MMQIGDKSCWWNRELPMTRIRIGFALMLVLLCGYSYLEPVLNTWTWALTHRSTATYQGLHVKVPWMWKQVDTFAGEREIRLERVRWGDPIPFESIVIHDDTASPPHTQTMTQRFEMLSSKLGESAYRGESLPLDSSIAAHYSCIAPRLTKLPTFRVSCESKDEQQSIDLFGPGQDTDDLIVLLHNLSSAQRALPPHS
ncbi:hypothetical protein HDF17_003078 [Granulicella arctica]|uniref:Uncharacterized protein n=1 Tax=Granulicella arctica TaxID=940613 RepID=A0A7Y9TUB2_9BACT|nr:hypothetical protein [Granulicella arctica]